MVKEKISLSEKIVGSQGHKYTFLFADVKQNIQNAQERIKEELDKEKIEKTEGLGKIKEGYYLGWNDCLAQIEEMEIIDKIFKEEFGDKLT